MSIFFARLRSYDAFAALCMPAAPAIAQPPELEEIVVTANKRAEVITDVSGSVQVYEMEDVLDKGVRDLANLYRITPGLSTYSKFTPSRSSFAFRGVQPTVGHDATTGLYYDGAPMATPGYSFAPTSDIFDLERIEVLKGPQGTAKAPWAARSASSPITPTPPADFTARSKAPLI